MTSSRSCSRGPALPPAQLRLCSGMQMPQCSCPCRPVPLAMLTGHLVMSSGHSWGSIEAGCSHTLQQQSTHQPEKCLSPEPGRISTLCCAQAAIPQLPVSLGGDTDTPDQISQGHAGQSLSLLPAEITKAGSIQLPSNKLDPFQVDTPQGQEFSWFQLFISPQ